MPSIDTLTVQVTTEPLPEWNESITTGNCRSLKMYHGVPWSERMQSFLGYQPLFFSINDAENNSLLLAAYIGVPWRIRHLNNRLRCFLSALLRARIGSLFWYGEPVVIGSPSHKHYQKLALSLEAEARHRRLRISSGVWPIPYESLLSKKWTVGRWGTIQIDLTQTKAELLAGAKPSARKALRRAERDGITVRRIATLEDLDTYYIFACRCAKRYKKHMYGFEDFRNMWEQIRPQAYFETFVAEHKNEMIAGLSIWGQGNSIGELGSFQSERSFQEKLYGPDAIKWAVLSWAHDQGLATLDLSGVNPAPKGKEIGIRQFKEKWGGIYYEYTTIN